MAIDQPQDLLYTVTKKMLPDLGVVFGTAHPAVDAIKKKSENVPFTTNRTYFDVATGSPATSIHAQTGGELITSTRKQVLRQGYIDPARCIWTWNVPCLELSRCGSKDDIYKIFNKYPKLVMIGAGQQVARQFIRGASSAGTDPDGHYGVKGLCTLNADQSFVPTSTSFGGVLGYAGRSAAPDSGTGQTRTVFGLPQEDAATDPVTGWYHQYENIGSMSTDGRRLINTVMQRANYQGETEERVDLMMADEASFQNIVMDMEGLVWIQDKLDSPSTAAQTREGVMYGKTPLYQEPEIDLTDTTAYSTAAAQTGIIIGLATGSWKLGFAGGNSQLATNGNFELMKPILLQDQDAWQYRMIADLNFFCTDLRRQFILTGGATE